MLCRWACLGHRQRCSRESLLSLWWDRRIEGPLVAGIGSDLTPFGFGFSLICFALLDLWYFLCYYNDSFITHTNRYVHLHLWSKGEDRSVLINLFFFFFLNFVIRFPIWCGSMFFVCSGYHRSWNWKIERVWICDLRLGAGDERRNRRNERSEPRRS